MTVVCDASAVFELLLGDEFGLRVAEVLDGTDVHAPHIALFETANALRNAELQSRISVASAVGAMSGLYELEIEYWPFEAVATRAWELRQNLTFYDASYVALAEQLQAPLVTVDERLARAPGTHCEFIVP
ncbi:MAG: hypothetical protein QOF21_654 [Actinomycetota bacterium]